MNRARWQWLVPALMLVLSLALARSAAAAPLLEVTTPTGTRTFTLAQLKKLPPTSGFAGVLSSSGKITVPSRYRGVSLADLMSAVGGYDEAKNLVITAKDGYSMTYTHEQVTKGTFTTFDPGTGDTLAEHEPLTVILTWEHEGRPLAAAEDGPLRLVVVSAAARQVTDGHWATKWVTRMAVEPTRLAWSLEMVGARNEVMDRATFESGASPGCHGVTWRDMQGRTWAGVPLWLMVGRVDDQRKHGTGAFVDSLAAGYTVELIGADGARVSFPGARVSRNDGILLAHMVNGTPLAGAAFPLQLAGSDVKGEERLGGIVKLVLHGPGMSPAPGGGPAK